MQGYIGLAPDHTQKSDILVIFLGGKFPYILRKAGNEMYRFIGEAYVHDIMYEQFMEGDLKIEKFILE